MRAAGRAAFVAVTLISAGAPTATSVAQATPDGLTLNVVGACPDAAAVRRLLGQLLSPEEARVAPVSVQDRGAQFRVAVRETEMMFDDPARSCEMRARQAAVVAANELHARRQVFGPPTIMFEKGAVFEAASTSDGLVWAPGAETRAAVGSGSWSLVGAAGARGPSTLTLMHGWKAEELRFPLDAGARLTSYRFGRFRPWLTLSGSLTVTGIVGHELVQTDRVWRLDPGALVMAGATLRMFGRFGGMAALIVRWQPRPYQLQVVPMGDVGQTPTWWFGLSLNYTIDGNGSTPP